MVRYTQAWVKKKSVLDYKCEVVVWSALLVYSSLPQLLWRFGAPFWDHSPWPLPYTCPSPKEAPEERRRRRRRSEEGCDAWWLALPYFFFIYPLSKLDEKESCLSVCSQPPVIIITTNCLLHNAVVTATILKSFIFSGELLSHFFREHSYRNWCRDCNQLQSNQLLQDLHPSLYFFCCSPIWWTPGSYYPRCHVALHAYWCTELLNLAHFLPSI